MYVKYTYRHKTMDRKDVGTSNLLRLILLTAIDRMTLILLQPVNDANECVTSPNIIDILECMRITKK